MNNLSFSALNTPTAKRQIFALGLSLSIFAVMFGLLFLKKSMPGLEKEELVVREITLAPPPPPPPPPPQQQKSVEAKMQLNVDGGGAAIEISEVKVQDPLENLDLVSPNIQTLATDWSLDLNVDWSAYGLDDLDGVPILLTPLKADWPKALSRRGIDKATVKLDIFIDENGRLSLVGIQNNDYPELLESINRVIRTTRFSIPQKSGQPVRARFVWPVEFVKP